MSLTVGARRPMIPDAGTPPAASPGPASRGPAADPGTRAVFLALLGLAAVLWLGTIVNKMLDEDESQHLHAAWLVAQGKVPFADFWEHHTPGLYYLLAPLTQAFPDSPAVYFVGRTGMALVGVLAVLLVFRLARPLSAGTAMAAVALVALLPRFVEYVTDVRPDVPALVAWLAALLALTRWRERAASGWLWAAGVALGIGAVFTPKVAYGAVGVAALVALVSRPPGAGGAGPALGALARLAAGAGAPVLALVVLLRFHGGAAAHDGFVEHVLAGTLDFADFTKEWPFTEEGTGFLLLALAGVGLTVREHGRALLRHPLHGPLLVPAGVATAILLLPTTPAVYRHAWLPVVAAAAVYAGRALAAALARARTTGTRGAIALAVVAVAMGLLGPAGMSARKALRDGNHEQLAVMRRELTYACPGEPVLDGTALYVFRPAAYRYRTLITGVRAWIAEGVIPEARIVEDLRRTRPRVAYRDRRLRSLTGPVATFLARHYVPVRDGLFVAGAAIPVAGGPGGRAEVELLVGDLYRVLVSPGIAATLDGVALRPGVTRLAAGPHALAWAGLPGTIELALLGCPERRALAARDGAAPPPGASPGALSRLASRVTVTERPHIRAILAPPSPA